MSNNATKELTKETSTNGSSKATATIPEAEVIPTTEVNYDVTKLDIDNLAQVFALARKQVVNDEANLAQLINYRQELTAKLTKLIKD